MKQLIYLLFASYFLYHLQGLLYAQGSGLSVMFLLAFFAVCGWGAANVLMYGGNSYSRMLMVFIGIQILYFLFAPQYIMSKAGPIQSLAQLKSVFISLMPFFPVYYVARRKDLTILLKIVAFLFLLLYIAQFFFNEQRLTDELDPEQRSENVVNNVAYSFVNLLPFVCLFLNKKLLSIGLWLCCCVFVLLGAKRGAIITGAISSIIYVWFLLKGSVRSRKYGALIAVFLMLCIGFYYGYQFVSEDEYLVYRFEELAAGNSSGRSIIYQKIFDTWNGTTSLGHFLFGFGFNSSISIAGNYAHNDWLELLSCSGLLGVIVYALMFWQLFRYYRRLYVIENRSMFAMIVVSWLCMSAFSMGYAGISLFSILLGYVMGNKEKYSNSMETIRISTGIKRK